MADMLVKLYHVTPDHALIARLAQQQIAIKRALAPDTRRVLRFIETSADTHWPQESSESWIGEGAAAMANHPPTCLLAVQQRTIIGFACYSSHYSTALWPNRFCDLCNEHWYDLRGQPTSYTISETVEDGIERIVYTPDARRFQTPIVFQHGMWHGTWWMRIRRTPTISAAGATSGSLALRAGRYGESSRASSVSWTHVPTSTSCTLCRPLVVMVTPR